MPGGMAVCGSDRFGLRSLPKPISMPRALRMLLPLRITAMVDTNAMSVPSPRTPFTCQGKVGFGGYHLGQPFLREATSSLCCPFCRLARHLLLGRVPVSPLPRRLIPFSFPTKGALLVLHSRLPPCC